MRLAITGTPGTGKTALAKSLAKRLGCKVMNEKDFALAHRLGSFNEENELEIPLPAFAKKMNTYLAKEKNVIIEGHLLCEMKLAVDNILVITIDPEELEARLESRNYPPVKVMDNVFCEGIEYCKKQALKQYPKSSILFIKSAHDPAVTLAHATLALKLPKKRQ